jgi:glycosyltransferase involved in cell wall biosynthesis
VVVIPTRNRGSIAMNAIRSVLDQEAENVDLLVSDNSTSESDRETLASFHASCADKRLRYVRPPEPLSMTAHWEWAIQQALGSYSASHFLFLTDRMMFRSGAVNDVLRLAARYPDKIISYNSTGLLTIRRRSKLNSIREAEDCLQSPPNDCRSFSRNQCFIRHCRACLIALCRERYSGESMSASGMSSRRPRRISISVAVV